MQISRERHSVYFGLMVTPTMRDKLEAEAVKRGVSVASVIREAVRLRLQDERRADR
jgi:hypothetical protein